MELSFRGSSGSGKVEKGSTRDLLLPVLSSLLPQLLGDFTNFGDENHDSNLESVLSQVAEGIHMLTGGVATIKMPPPLSSTPSSSALFPAKEPGIIVSCSAEAAGSALRTQGREKRSKTLMDERILDRSKPSIPESRLGSVGESDVNQILLKLVTRCGLGEGPEGEAEREGRGRGQEQLAIGDVTVSVQSAQCVRGFSSEQQEATRLIALLLSHSISVQSAVQLHKVTSERSGNDLRCLNAAIRVCEERTALDGAALAEAKLQSFSAFDLAHFSSQCCGISTLVGLGTLVADILPQAFRAKKVVLLLLRDDPRAGRTGAPGRPFFLPVLPEGLTDDQNLINHTTLDQMSRIQDYSESSRSRHSRVMLVREESGVTYGALLVLRTPVEGEAVSVGSTQSDSRSDAAIIVTAAITGESAPRTEGRNAPTV